MKPVSRRELETKAGYNVVVAKVCETHDLLCDLAERMTRMVERAHTTGTSGPVEPAWMTPVAGTDPPWTPPAEGTFVKTLLAFHEKFDTNVRIHHTVEDDIIFPFIRERYGFDSSALDHEHHELLATTTAIAQEITSLCGSPRPPNDPDVTAFASSLAVLREQLTRHVDNEEATAVIAMLQLTPKDIQTMFGGRL